MIRPLGSDLASTIGRVIFIDPNRNYFLALSVLIIPLVRMKNLSISLATGFISMLATWLMPLAVVAQKLDRVALEYNLSLQESTLKQHLQILAHDSLQGREAGTIGHEKACNYLIRQYKKLGIPALSGTDNYRQTFTVPITKWDLFDCRIRDVKERRYMHGRDFMMLPGTRMPSEQSLQDKRFRVRWAGLGPDCDTLNLLSGLGLTGEVTETEPTLWLLLDSASVPGLNQAYWAKHNLEARFKAMRRKVRGPIMIITTRFDWWQQNVDNFWAEEAHGFTAGRRGNTPTMVCGPRMARMFLRKATYNSLSQWWPLFQNLAKEGSAMEAFTFLNLESLINTWGKATSTGHSTGWPYITDADTARFLLTLRPTVYHTSNVMAVIRGTKKPDEAVVISAHSDHIGRDAFDIYNGADDDGTGTAALLTMAEQFAFAAKAKQGPERTIIFAHFTAEEKGLLGSAHYAKEPLWPMASTMVDLNVDMIGRSDDRHPSGKPYIYAIGSDKIKQSLKEQHEAINDKCCNIGLDYYYDRPDDTEHLYERSDHYNFAKSGVPVIFYFSGLHPDYHGVNDHVERIEWTNYLGRTRLIFNMGWHLSRSRTKL